MTLWSKQFDMVGSFSWRFELETCSFQIRALQFCFQRHVVAWWHVSLCFCSVLVFKNQILKSDIFSLSVRPCGLNLVMYWQGLPDGWLRGIPTCCPPPMPPGSFSSRAHCRPQAFFWGIEAPLRSLLIKRHCSDLTVKCLVSNQLEPHISLNINNMKCDGSRTLSFLLKSVLL